MSKVLLYSGGMDSYIISKLWKPDKKIYFDYGTEQTKAEIEHLPADVEIVPLPIGQYTEDDGLHTIPLRNLIFAAIAVNYGDVIAIGGLKSDLHFDKKPEFVKRCTDLFNSVLQKERSHRTVEICVPYGEFTKTELICAYLDAGGTVDDIIENSWSCYQPVDGKPCGKCKACKARADALNEAIVSRSKQ